MLGERLGSSALTLLVPSLKPNMLRAVTWLVLVDEVRPKPSWLQRTATVPKPIRTRLRIACTATCGSFGTGLYADVPAAAGRVEVVAAEGGQVLEALRPRSARPNRPSKSEGPKPIVRVRPEASRS